LKTPKRGGAATYSSKIDYFFKIVQEYACVGVNLPIYRLFKGIKARRMSSGVVVLMGIHAACAVLKSVNEYLQAIRQH